MTFVAVGFAALFLWYLLAEATITERVFAYPREHWSALWNCPWCSGFWLTGGITLVTGYDWLTHLAAAGVVGFVGSKAI